MKRMILILCVTMITSACAASANKPHSANESGSTITSDTVDMTTLLDKQWILQEMSGQSVLDTPQITLELTNDAIRGHAGCNTYTAPYQISDAEFWISDFSITLAACDDERIMQQEDEYVATMINVKKFHSSDGVLTLMDKENNVLFKYVLQ